MEGQRSLAEPYGGQVGLGLRWTAMTWTTSPGGLIPVPHSCASHLGPCLAWLGGCYSSLSGIEDKNYRTWCFFYLEIWNPGLFRCILWCWSILEDIGRLSWTTSIWDIFPCDMSIILSFSSIHVRRYPANEAVQLCWPRHWDLCHHGISRYHDEDLGQLGGSRYRYCYIYNYIYIDIHIYI